MYYCCTQQQQLLSSGSKQQPARHCKPSSHHCPHHHLVVHHHPHIRYGDQSRLGAVYTRAVPCSIYLGLCLFVFLLCVTPPPAAVAAVFFSKRKLAWSVSETKLVNPKSIHLIGVLRFLKIGLGLTAHHRGSRVCDVKPDTCGDGTCSCRMRCMDRAVTAHRKKSPCTRHACCRIKVNEIMGMGKF